MVGHQNLFQLCAAIHVAITNTVCDFANKKSTHTEIHGESFKVYRCKVYMTLYAFD